MVLEETFFDSLHINGRPSGQTIGESILSLLGKNKIDIEKCRAQAYDGASVICGNSSGAASVIKKKQPHAKCTDCRNHILSLAISFKNSHQRCSVRKGVLRNFSKFRASFLLKLLKKEAHSQVFSCEF